MDHLTPITPGELLDEEFLQPLGVSQYRLAKAIDVPASRICAFAVFWDCALATGCVPRPPMTPRWLALSWPKRLRGLSRWWSAIEGAPPLQTIQTSLDSCRTKAGTWCRALWGVPMAVAARPAVLKVVGSNGQISLGKQSRSTQTE